MNQNFLQPITLGDYQKEQERKEAHEYLFELEILNADSAHSALDNQPNNWYSVKEFAEKAGVPTNTVYQWAKRDRVRSDTNSNGTMVIYPPDLMKVPRPVAFEEQERIVWTGTFSESGRVTLNQFALGGNESYTLEMGARFLLAMLGVTPLEESRVTVKELWEYINKHQDLATIFKRNLRLMLSALED